MFKRELQGALVSPWMLFGRDSRIVTLFGQIYSSTDVETITGESTPFPAEEAYGAMILLASESKDPVKIIINNRGGFTSAGLLVIGAIEHLQKQDIEVQTLVIGSSMSAATWILSAGTTGKRYALKRSIINLSNPTVPSTRGLTSEDLNAVQGLSERQKNSVYALLAEKTKLPEYQQKKMGEEEGADFDISNPEYRKTMIQTMMGSSDTFLSPEEALEAGIIDKVFDPGDPHVDEIFRVPAKHKKAGFRDAEEVLK